MIIGVPKMRGSLLIHLDKTLIFPLLYHPLGQFRFFFFGSFFDFVSFLFNFEHPTYRPEPVENEINQILGSKHNTRFSEHSFDLVQNTYLFCFSYLLRLNTFCKGPRSM